MVNLSVIIPAFNENEDILNLINELKRIENVSIIVVDDHSEEVFAELYRGIEGITLIRHEYNKGKAAAIKTGIDVSTTEYLLIIDADLIGMTANHIKGVLALAQDNDVICMVRGADNKLFTLLGSTFIARGEHLITKTFIKQYEDQLFDGTRWSFENNLNKILIKEKPRYVFCELRGLNHKVKAKKYPFFTGLYLDLKMAYQVGIQKYKLVFWLTTYFGLYPKFRTRIIIEQ